MGQGFMGDIMATPYLSFHLMKKTIQQSECKRFFRSMSNKLIFTNQNTQYYKLDMMRCLDLIEKNLNIQTTF